MEISTAGKPKQISGTTQTRPDQIRFADMMTLDRSL